MKLFPKLSEAHEKTLVEQLSHWLLANGLVMYPPNFSAYAANTAPVTLFPTPFPKDLFERAVEVQKSFNLLYANIVANHKDWLLSTIKDLAVFDKDFTGKLLETYEQAVAAGEGKVAQPLSLGLFRLDYMLNESDHSIKQIEFNTVSVSFGGLSLKIGQAHNFLNSVGAYDDDYSGRYYAKGEIPVSDLVRQLADGLAQGNLSYHKTINGGTTDSTNSVVLFVVQQGERNCFDQRLVEYALLENHGIKSYRLPLELINSHTTINSGKLYIKESMDEISVVYYRSGYSPSDYESDPETTWAARLHLETSKAIKCPSVLTQLLGAKKIQQLLTQPETLVKILPDADEAELGRLVSTFVKIYPMDDSEAGQKARQLALESPDNFVLKPQREGGGNNIYKAQIPAFLRSLPESEWGAYVLMELIHPPTHKNKLLRDGKVYNEEIISELGIFGVTLFDENGGEPILNENAGFLLRSKFSSSDEGGVAAGFGCVDNIYVY